MIASWSRGTVFSWLGEQRSDACCFFSGQLFRNTKVAFNDK